MRINQEDMTDRLITVGVVIAGLVGVMALIGGVVYAEQSPGVREITANERVLMPLTTRIRFTSVIVLPDGEEITDVICGDKDNWVVNADRNVAYVKPAKEGATTNLNLRTTTGSIHSFTLIESAKAQTDLKLYVMADPSTAPKAQQFVPASTLTDLANALADIKADIRQSEARVTAVRATQQAEEQASKVNYPSTLKFTYTWDKKKNGLGVQAIWHDDLHTYIRAEKPQQGAALYEVVGNEPSLVEFDLTNGLYTVNKVLGKGVLVKGKDRLEFANTSATN